MAVYSWAAPKGKEWFQPNIYREIVTKAQVSNGLEKTAVNTWKVPQNWNRVPKTPSWAKPDADSKPDPWDDDL